MKQGKRSPGGHKSQKGYKENIYSFASLASLAFMAFFAFPLWAGVEIVLRLDKNKMLLGDTAALEISVNGSSGGLSEPKIIIPPELSVYSQSKSQKVEIVNWKMTTSVIYTLLLSASKPGAYKLGPAKIDAGGGQEIASNTVSIEVADQKSAQVQGAPQGIIQPFAVPNFPRTTRQMLEDKRAERAQSPGPGPDGETRRKGPKEAPEEAPPLVFIEARTDKHEAYVGEPVKLSVLFYTRVAFLSQPQYVPPNTSGFWQENLPQKTFQTNVRGTPYQATEIPLILFPTNPGKLKISPAKVQMEIEQAGAGSNDPFDPQFFQRFFGGGSGQTHLLETKSVEITAFALPQESRPRDFSGAVGQFDLEAGLDKTGIKIGDTLTLTVAISGEGNIRSLPSPAYPNLEGVFRSYETEKTETITKQDGKISGKKTFKLLLIPQVPGNPALIIPPIRFVYFDPKAKGYVRRETRPLSVNVSGEPIHTASGAAGGRGDAKKFGEDIGFIIEATPAPGIFHRLSMTLTRRWAGAGGLPVLLWLATSAIGMARKKRLAKKSRPLERLADAIKKASVLAQENKPIEMAGALAPALEGALRQILGLAEAVTPKTLPEEIANKARGKISSAEVQTLRQTLESLHYLRFAPARQEEAQEILSEVLEGVLQAKKILEKLS